MASLKLVAPTKVRRISDYHRFCPKAVIEEITEKAKLLKDVKITVVSSTSSGGGVAEIWHSLIPMLTSVGVNISWYEIKAQENFFEVTKKLHNLLQGQKGKLTDKEKGIYLAVNKSLAKKVAKIPTDILLIHDPQPTAIVAFFTNHILKKQFQTIWRCHIDTSSPNKTAWEFFRNYLDYYDKLIFTLPEYTNHRFPENKIIFFQPTIDPLAGKLAPTGKKTANKILEGFGIRPDKPLILASSRFDPWKDFPGVFEAYLLVKKHIPPCQILFTGPLATDDPEAIKVQKKLIKTVKKTAGITLGKDVFIYSNKDAFSYQQLNAAYVAADIVIQKSLVEGFGLTVTEASFMGKTVIGSNVPGIAYQIINFANDHQRGTGILVDVKTADRGIAETAVWAEVLLSTPKLAKTLGKRAKKRIVRHFLHPKLCLNYLNLFSNLIKKERGVTIPKEKVAADYYYPTI